MVSRRAQVVDVGPLIHAAARPARPNPAIDGSSLKQALRQPRRLKGVGRETATRPYSKIRRAYFSKACTSGRYRQRRTSAVGPLARRTAGRWQQCAGRLGWLRGKAARPPPTAGHARGRDQDGRRHGGGVGLAGTPCVTCSGASDAARGPGQAWHTPNGGGRCPVAADARLT